jgi:2,4-dienoyl-CoA reductase-like NADH-dependent reductase (Old Yellow Enzyme family)
MSTVLRKASGLPVITNGGIAEGAQAEDVLTTGAGDMVAIGRPIFAQPDWPYIVRSGAAYNWAEFDRKYVVRPPIDYAIAYPMALTDPKWPTI